MHKARVCPNSFGATFAAVFVFDLPVERIPLSAGDGHFELRNQLKQLMLCITKFPLVGPTMLLRTKLHGHFLR